MSTPPAKLYRWTCDRKFTSYSPANGFTAPGLWQFPGGMSDEQWLEQAGLHIASVYSQTQTTGTALISLSDSLSGSQLYAYEATKKGDTNVRLFEVDTAAMLAAGCILRNSEQLRSGILRNSKRLRSDNKNARPWEWLVEGNVPAGMLSELPMPTHAEEGELHKDDYEPWEAYDCQVTVLYTRLYYSHYGKKGAWQAGQVWVTRSYVDGRIETDSF